ncbi:MAG: hypothetical protein AB1449_10710 [Chloroflexota bacterium]
MTPTLRPSDGCTALARSITRLASRQTYLTIHWLVGPDLVSDAFRAYACFRWVDDVIVAWLTTRAQRVSFIEEQAALMERAYAGDAPPR